MLQQKAQNYCSINCGIVVISTYWQYFSQINTMKPHYFLRLLRKMTYFAL